MELYNIYCGFWERMKKNKCGGVPKWLYMVGNLREKRKVDCSKRPSEKKKKKKKFEKIWSWTKEKKKKMKKEKRSRSAIWALLCKVSGIGIIWKEKLCSTSLRNTLCLIYIFSS